MTNYNYSIVEKHITTIAVGDVIEHMGKHVTVGRNNIGNDAWHGRTLFGDSYYGGRLAVKKVLIKKAMPVKA